MRDVLGNEVTLADAASLPALNDFVEGFIACEARAVNILQAQADESPIVQAFLAALHMFAESREGPVNARPFIEKAQSSSLQANEREQRFVRAVAAWVDGDIPGAIRLHEEQAREHPRDLASLKLGQYHLFNLGDAAGMLRIALAALPSASDVPYMHGMAAFGWEQCHLLGEAEKEARTAIAMRRKEPWAHHALAHVLLTQGRIPEGIAFLGDVSATWTDLNSFMVTHNWWHQALFLIELERFDEVLALYDANVWGVVKEYTQDQVGAVSLLARLELAGADVGDRWSDLATYLVKRTSDQVLPFLDLQYLYGLARAGRGEADALMRNIERHAENAPAFSQHAWRKVCVPAGRALLAHARGRWDEAVDGMGQALPSMMEVGGSHAQRDLFNQVYINALMKSGRWGAAQQLLQVQVAGQPESLRLKRQARRTYASLGLGGATSLA